MLMARGEKKFNFIYYTWIDNDKHRFYYKRLADIAERSIYIHLNARGPTHFYRFFRAFKCLQASAEATLAFSSIDSIYIQYAIKKFAPRTIITFDDGSANINKNSFYFKIKKMPILRRLACWLVRGDVDQNWIKKNSRAHYTIYSDFENIVEDNRVISVKLLASRDRSIKKHTKQRALRVFLGEPVSELHHDHLSRDYINILKNLDIDKYLPHPREYNLHAIKNIIETNLIAEDYISQCLDEFELVHVYSLFSTALLNIDHPRLIKTIVIYRNVDDKIKSIYPLFEKRGCQFEYVKYLEALPR